MSDKHAGPNQADIIPSGTSLGGGEAPGQPPRESVNRGDLYQELAWALHAMRSFRLGETDTAEFEAVKELAEADTQELIIVPSVTGSRPKPEDPDRELTEKELRVVARKQKRDRRQRPVKVAQEVGRQFKDTKKPRDRSSGR